MNASEAEGNALATQIAIAMLMAHNRDIDVTKLGELGHSIMETVLQSQREPGQMQAEVLQDMADRAQESLETIGRFADLIRTHVLPAPEQT